MTEDTEKAPRSAPGIRIAAGAIAVVLLALLGFAIVVQVRANSGSDNLANLRESDLVGILDDQNARADRLRQQIADLDQTLRRLQDSGNRSAAARQQAQEDAKALGVLLGTLPATGPGVEVTISDADRKLSAEDLLDVVEELRGAGAEAIQFATVRISTNSAFTQQGRSVAVDGSALAPPYHVLAIGERKTLDTALNIPGGVADAVRAAGGTLTVRELPKVSITVTRRLPTPRYLTPSGH
ncbi:MAG: DUF881 domain-containing protein [Actinomycetota bacterium]|nr:DUF881 domain-containing protein [Actinomycetota bacterium]